MSGRERTSGPRLRQPAQRPVQSVLSGKRKVSMARQAGTRMKSRVMSFMMSEIFDTLCCRIDGEGKNFLEDTESYIHVVKLALWTEHSHTCLVYTSKRSSVLVTTMSNQ
jgi:hypothetical protein